MALPTGDESAAMILEDVYYRVEHPLLYSDSTLPDKARQLQFCECTKSHAVALVRQWHSRLPNTQDGPWMYAFKAYYGDVTYAVALWNNPSARTLPGHWVELRRMAVAPDAPKFTASRFLGYMLRWFRQHHPEHERAISYQDTAVHSGTIYKATNWTPAHTTVFRHRDRSKPRVNTRRDYRSNLNGDDTDASVKVRWEFCF